MSEPAQKMNFHVEAMRVDAHGSLARCKNAEIALDTDLVGKPDAFNPAELLLAALSAHVVMPAGHPGDACFNAIATALHDRYEITHPTIQIDLCRIDHGCVAPRLD